MGYFGSEFPAISGLATSGRHNSAMITYRRSVIIAELWQPGPEVAKR